jgi:hypothetical protein
MTAEVFNYSVRDSGNRQKFPTGAQRDIQQGKGRFDLLAPRAEARKAELNEAGAAKYEAWNVAKGMPIARLIDSARRHINAWMTGKRDEDHLVQASWNLDWAVETLALIESGDLPCSLLDELPPWSPELSKDWQPTTPVGRAAKRIMDDTRQALKEVGFPQSTKVIRRFRRIRRSRLVCPEAVIYSDGSGDWIGDDGSPNGGGPSSSIAKSILRKLQDGTLYEVDAEANTHADCSVL